MCSSLLREGVERTNYLGFWFFFCSELENTPLKSEFGSCATPQLRPRQATEIEVCARQEKPLNPKICAFKVGAKVEEKAVTASLSRRVVCIKNHSKKLHFLLVCLSLLHPRHGLYRSVNDNRFSSNRSITPKSCKIFLQNLQNLMQKKFCTIPEAGKGWEALCT